MASSVLADLGGEASGEAGMERNPMMAIHCDVASPQGYWKGVSKIQRALGPAGIRVFTVMGLRIQGFLA
jgi:hypothetical protein